MIRMLTRLTRPWLAIGGATVLLVALAACSQLPIAPWPRTVTGNGAAASDQALLIVATAPAAQTDAAEATPAAPAAATSVLAVARGAQATPTGDQASRGSIPVKRGPIAEDLPLNGRIVGVNELSSRFHRAAW